MAKTLTKPEEKHIEKHVEKHLIANLPAYFSAQFKQHVSTAIIAAFSFLIALAWKDLIVNLVSKMTGTELLGKYPYLVSLYSAIIVTLIAVIGIALVTNWAKKPEVLTSESTTK